MNGYFDEKEQPRRVLAEAKLPVRTKEGNDWEKLSGPNRYKKKYKFHCVSNGNFV